LLTVNALHTKTVTMNLYPHEHLSKYVKALNAKTSSV